MAPEKWWLEDYFPIGKVTFQGRTVKLREGKGFEKELTSCDFAAKSLTFSWTMFRNLTINPKWVKLWSKKIPTDPRTYPT